jgi:hypothetical protein
MRKNSQVLDSILQERLGPYLDAIQGRIQRTLRGPVTRNGCSAFLIRKYRKVRELKSLAVLSYYISEYGVLLRADLESLALSHLAYPQAVELASMLSSKEEMLNNLVFSLSDDDFFGNFLPIVERTADSLQFLTLYPRRARRVERHRGYRDHGSCRPESSWLPKSDWSFTEEQNRLEQRKFFVGQHLSGIMKEGATKWILNYFERETIFG